MHGKNYCPGGRCLEVNEGLKVQKEGIPVFLMCGTLYPSTGEHTVDITCLPSDNSSSLYPLHTTCIPSENSFDHIYTSRMVLENPGKISSQNNTSGHLYQHYLQPLDKVSNPPPPPPPPKLSLRPC